MHVSFLYFFTDTFGILGVTMAMILSSAITFIFSHVFYITKLFKLFNFNVSSVFKVDFHSAKELLLPSAVKGFSSYLEYLGYGILVLSAYNMDQLMIPHILLYSILIVPHIFSEGFALTIKIYLNEIKHVKASYESRKKYIICFILLITTIALIFSILFITLGDKIALLYYPQLTEEMILIYSNVISYYSIIIVFDFLSVFLDGFIRGKEGETQKLSIYKAIVFCIICIPAGLFITHYYGMGILGIWMIIFVYIIIHFIADMIYVYKVHGLYAFKE